MPLYAILERQQSIRACDPALVLPFCSGNLLDRNTLPKQLQALADVSLIILRSECAQIDLEEIMKLKDG